MSVENFDMPPHYIRVHVPRVTSGSGVWALPCWPEPKSVRADVAPEPGEGVWVMFEGGDPGYPVVVGFFGDDRVQQTPIAPDKGD